MKLLQLFPPLLVLLLVSLRPVLGHFPEMDGVQVRCFEKERQALLKIKGELVDIYGRLSSWGNQENNKDCCKWRGIRCDNRTNHVRRLDLRCPSGSWGLPGPQLKGTISTSLPELKHLRYLDLSYNDFNYSPIPLFISSLTKLRHLKLAGANFVGPIPHRIGNLSNLLHLDFGQNTNCYSESLEWLSHLHSLEYLDLSGMNLSKATNWLQAISKLTSIKELDVPRCALPDITLPSLPSVNANSTSLSILDLEGNWFTISTLTLIHWFSNFSSSGLSVLNLRANHMPGPIPDVFENMVSLEQLSLGGTGLEGGIPKYFGNMSNLIELLLEVNNLTGEFSKLMANLSGPIERKLEYLDLSFNRISGPVSNMSRFPSLEGLFLQENRLSGSIPAGYLKLPSLLYLYLSSNQLIGSVPDLSFCSSLRYLELDKNTFNEISPQSIGHLSKLEVLNIGSNLLEGTITEAHMVNLSKLLKLNLGQNIFLKVKFSPEWVPPFQLLVLELKNCSLGPHFPWWLKSQKELFYIDISGAGISDIIPSWFVDVSRQLQVLGASDNQLYGEIPSFSFSISNSSTLPQGMVTLDLARNKIGGSLKFLCYTKGLLVLDLSDNHFFDQIPDCLASFEQLEYLNLANNQLFGKIPYWFGSLSAISILHLRNNNFSGELPTSMGNCMNLNAIDLGENRLTGQIPAWIGNRFSRLKILVLRFNEFYGGIPPSLCGLIDIRILDLSSNKISGVVPNCMHKYVAMTQHDDDYPTVRFTVFFPHGWISQMASTNYVGSSYFMWKGKESLYINHPGLMRLIDLSNNNLTGEIPSEITELVGLIELNFSMNNLIGPIPPNIGQLKMLESLDFSRNHLSGSIPNSLGELGFLGVLDLSYNNLSGRIPPINKLPTFNETSYMGNSGLCGLPLNKSCIGDNESQQDLDPSVDGNNEMSTGESIDDDEFITEGFYIALGLGFIVGFWGVFGTILFNKTMQYAFLKLLNIVGDFAYVRMELSKARLLRLFKTQ